MNAIIVFATFFALAAAGTYEQGVHLTEDTLGNYHLKYKTHESAREEQRFHDGKVVGSYSYVDTDGVHHKVNYVGGAEHGFHVESADLPRPVHDTYEVAAARAAHLAVAEHARSVLPPYHEHEQVYYVPSVHSFTTPYYGLHTPARYYYDNTAELEAAKAEHFAAHYAARARLAEEYRRFGAF